MSLDKEIVEEFLNESKSLIEDLVELLESIEGDFSQVKKLADYGNNVDRIMGGAKSLALMAPPEHAIHLIADYSALCKAVGYKASQINNNEKFYDICVAILLDATENLRELLNNIFEDVNKLKEEIPEAFIERLRWVSQQFNESYSMSVGLGSADAKDPAKMKQSEIDDLLKKLGL
jgi:citrate synthase